MITGILLFGLILFSIFCCRCEKLRIQGYIFSFVVCLLWPVSFLFVLILSPSQWKRILNVLRIKTNEL